MYSPQCFLYPGTQRNAISQPLWFSGMGTFNYDLSGMWPFQCMAAQGLLTVCLSSPGGGDTAPRDGVARWE